MMTVSRVCVFATPAPAHRFPSSSLANVAGAWLCQRETGTKFFDLSATMTVVMPITVTAVISTVVCTSTGVIIIRTFRSKQKMHRAELGVFRP